MLLPGEVADGFASGDHPAQTGLHRRDGGLQVEQLTAQAGRTAPTVTATHEARVFPEVADM
jgi:hypothetical protein